MTEPLTTPNRKLTWEEEMAWPRKPEPRQEDVEDDIMLDMIQPATPPGQPPAPPPKIDLEKVRETLDEQAFQLHCQGLSYRKIGQTMQKGPSTVYKCEHQCEQPGVHPAQVVEKPAVAPSAEKNANSVNTAPVAPASAPNPERNEQRVESLISQLRAQCEHKREQQGVHGAQRVEKPPVARRKKKRKPSVNTRPEHETDEEEFDEMT